MTTTMTHRVVVASFVDAMIDDHHLTATVTTRSSDDHHHTNHEKWRHSTDASDGIGHHDHHPNLSQPGAIRVAGMNNNSAAAVAPDGSAVVPDGAVAADGAVASSSSARNSNENGTDDVLALLGNSAVGFHDSHKTIICMRHNDDSSKRMEQHDVVDGSSSSPLELEGFLPTTPPPVQPKCYVVPDKDIQRLDHLYAPMEKSDTTAVTSSFRQRREKHLIKKKYYQACCIVILSILFIAVIAIPICGTIGSCYNRRGGSSSSSTDQPNSPSDIVSNTSDVVSSSSHGKKPFDTKQELINTIDQLLSGQNVSAVEETYGNITDWNVSFITDFSHLFSTYTRNDKASWFDEDISRWDVSSATNMSYMFYGAQRFRSDISQWNVSRVTDMRYFVAATDRFDADLSRWDVSQLMDASHMFYEAISFSGIGLEYWNVSQVRDMSAMFGATRESVSCIVTMANFSGNVSRWDVSNVQDMSDMFVRATFFNGDVSLWNVSNVKSMDGMFAYAESFQGIGVERWDIHNVVTMEEMFRQATSFDANLSNWDISHVNDTSFMFRQAYSYRGIGLEYWDTRNIVTMKGMFQNAVMFNANLSRWALSNVQDTSSMFDAATSFKGDGIEDWDTSNVRTMSRMFYYGVLSDVNFSQWNVTNVNDASSMFYGASSFQGVGIEDWDTHNIETMNHMFYQAYAFDANVSHWNVSHVQDASSMFEGASSFRGIGIDRWDTSHMTTMDGMFHDAIMFDANLSGWDVSNVTDTSAMFMGASSFRGDGLNVWNVSQLLDASYMFASAIDFRANLSQWDVTNVVNATGMFQNATSFDGVSWWNDTTSHAI